MKLELDDAQYQTLLEMMYLGMHVMGYVDEENQKLETYEQLEQYLLSQAKHFHAEDLMDYDEELDRYFMSATFESAMEPFIFDFIEFLFWEELAAHLAERDLSLEVGPDEPMTEEHLQRLFSLEKFYQDELAQHGLDRFVLSREAE